MFSGKTSQASGAFTMVSTSEHAALAGDPTREWNAEACGSQARSSSSRSSRVWSSEASGKSCWIMVKMWTANRQVSARESSSSADRRDRSIGATMPWPNRRSEEQDWRQEEAERSGGATGELLTGRPVGPRWLSNKEPHGRERPWAEGSESASGRGGARPWQGSGTQAPEAPPGGPGPMRNGVT